MTTPDIRTLHLDAGRQSTNLAIPSPEVPMAINLDAIRARANAASPGPWRPVDLRHQRGGQIRIFPAEGMIIANVLASGDNAGLDAEFIAAAREDIPALLAEIDLLRAELAADKVTRP